MSPIDTTDLFSRIQTVFEAGLLLTVCAWCQRVRIDDSWFTLPTAVRVAIDERHAFSHSICASCAESYMPPVAADGPGSQRSDNAGARPPAT